MMQTAAIAFFIILLTVSALIGMYLTKKEEERIKESAHSLRSPKANNTSELKN
ncbi:MAG: hypothetical protein ACI85I_001882 [Arenicella sp.]|jgi:hypothetical protein